VSGVGTTADAYRVLDRVIRVRCDPGPVRERLRSTYARFLDDASTATDASLVVSDRLEEFGELVIENGTELFRLHYTGSYGQFSCQNVATLEFEDLGFGSPDGVLETALVATLARLRPDHDFYHAAAVTLDGGAILMPAMAGLGKTTLVMALLEHGCLFLSDTVGCLERERRVVRPFAGCLRLPDRKGRIDVEVRFPGRIGKPAPLRHVLFLRGFADEPRLERLSRTRALMALRHYQFMAARNTAEKVFRSIDVVADADCFELVVGSPDETAALVASLPARIDDRGQA